MKIQDLYEAAKHIKFDNYDSLTSNLAWAIEERLSSLPNTIIELGSSNVSCSSYITASFYDEEDDFIDEIKIRFSDHADRHGSDITYNILHHITSIYIDYDNNETDEEYGDNGKNEFDHVEIAQDVFDGLVNTAVEYVIKKYDENR